nr:hypothetical protein [Tanacetum cinerariifolium]
DSAKPVSSRLPKSLSIKEEEPMEKEEGFLPHPKSKSFVLCSRTLQNQLRLEKIAREQIMAKEEIDDDVDDSLEALLLNFKKGSKLSRQERLIQDLSRGLGEGSVARIKTQDDRDSLDSDKTLSAPRLETVINEGEEDDASNFTVLVYEKKKVSKEKEIPIPKPISSPMTKTLEAVKNQKLNGIAEIDDEPQMSPDAQLLLNFKKGSKLSRQERLIQYLSMGPGEGSVARIKTQDDRDSLDSDKTLSAPRLETVINEGEEDDASNFTVLVY